MRIALLLLCSAASASGQPASDLLQSGIFEQETVGDLDSAIRIYRQILGSSTNLHLYAAQAQFRLGICLLRKGDKAAAAEALQAVIRNYPEERELAARARENMPGTGILMPAPWSETEVAEYRWTIPNVDDGWSLTRIAPTADRKNLRIQLNFYSPRLYSTTVDVEPAGMRPIQTTYRPPSQPVIHLATRVDRNGAKSYVAVRSYVPPIEASGTYAYGEVLYLLRRMPLYVGWTATIPVAVPGGGRIELKASVAGVETVTVPAGTFKCLRVLLATDPQTTPPKYSAAGTDWQVFGAGQSLWYAVDGARPLIKLQVASFSGELTSLRTGQQMGTTSFRDPQVGFSFTVPAGWIFHSRTAFAGPATSVDLLDPESQVMATISFKSKKTAAADIEQELLTGALEMQKERPALVTRDELQTGKIGGHPSITWMAERAAPGGKVTRYTVWIQSEATRGSIAAAVPTVDFERFREQFQAVINSFRMP